MPDPAAVIRALRWAPNQHYALFARVARWCAVDAEPLVVLVRDCRHAGGRPGGRPCRHRAGVDKIVQATHDPPVVDFRAGTRRWLGYTAGDLLDGRLDVAALEMSVAGACRVRIGAALSVEGARRSANDAARHVLAALAADDAGALAAAETRLGACCVGMTWVETAGLVGV